MRHHSTVGLITNSSSETFTIRADDVSSTVEKAINDLLAALHIDPIDNVSVEVTGHGDWIYGVCNEVFVELMADRPELFEGVAVNKWVDGTYQKSPHEGEWGQSEWEEIDQESDLYREFVARYDIEQRNYIQISRDHSGPVSIMSDIVIKIGDKVIELDQIPGLNEHIARELGY
jgi:hypothetical protein